MSAHLIVAVLSAAVVAATPLLYAGVGELVAELSGILNLGVEGMMLIGAMTAFAVGSSSHSLPLGVAAGMAAGALLGLVHGLMTVTLAADQVVSGLAITLFGTGISSYLGRSYVSGSLPVRYHLVAVPGLADIPYLGPILFHQNALVLVSYLVAPAVWVVLRFTGVGLSLRAAGESPRTADAMGINVFRVRYAAVAFGGLTAGLAGAFLSTAYLTSWTDGLTAGRGWIAIALVVFSAWRPGSVLAGAYLFGFADVLAFQTGIFGALARVVPSYFIRMVPYLLTLLVMVLTSRALIRRRIGAPAALMTAYVRGQR